MNHSFAFPKNFGRLDAQARTFAASILVSLALAIGVLLLAGGLPNSELLLFAVVMLPPFAVVFRADFEREKRVRKIEDALPAALFQLSSFPARAPVEKLVDSIASSNYGPLSEEFAKASRQIRSGAPVSHALSQMSRTAGSPLLSRVVELLLSAHEAGVDVAACLRELAEDSLKLSAIARESAASAALQKYTLLAAAAFIIPGVTGTLLSATSSLSFSGLQEFGLGASGAPAMRETLVLANQFYLAVFCLLASIFVARLEHSPKKAALYALFLIPCSLLVFAISSAGRLPG